MRTKSDILKEITKLPEPFGSIHRFKVLRDRLIIETLVDIRDILNKELKRIDTWETRFVKTP